VVQLSRTVSRKVTKLYEPTGKLLGRAEGVGIVAVGRSVAVGFSGSTIAVATGVAGSVEDASAPLFQEC